MRILAGELYKAVDVGVNDVLGGDLYEDPCPSNGLEGVKYHHHGLRIPVFLFLLDQGVVFANGEGLVGTIFLGIGVHGSGRCEGPDGDDFSQSHCLVVFGSGMFVPHPDQDFLGSKEKAFREWCGALVLVVGEELLVDSFRPCFGYLVIGSAGCGGVWYAGRCW